MSNVEALLVRETFEGAFPANVQVFHCHLRRFAIRADGEGDAAQADCVFPFGLVSECVAVVVLQRERFVSRPNYHGKRAVLFADGNAAKEIVLVGAGVGFQVQCRRGRRRSFRVIEAGTEAKQRRVGEDFLEEREPVVRRATVKRQVDKSGPEPFRESDRIGIGENDNPELFPRKKLDVRGGAEIERAYAGGAPD